MSKSELRSFVSTPTTLRSDSTSFKDSGSTGSRRGLRTSIRRALSRKKDLEVDKDTRALTEAFDRAKQEWDEERQRLEDRIVQLQNLSDTLTKREREYFDKVQSFANSVGMVPQSEFAKAAKCIQLFDQLQIVLYFVLALCVTLQHYLPDNSFQISIACSLLVATLLWRFGQVKPKSFKHVPLPREISSAPKPVVVTTTTNIEQGSVEDVESREVEPVFGTEAYEDARRRFIAEEVKKLSESEMKALVEMREFFKEKTCREIEQGVGSFRLDDSTFLRFLRARDFIFEKASAMLAEHVEWRDKFAPALIKPEEVRNGITCGVSRRCGRSFNGEPIVLVQLENFGPSDFPDVDSFIRTCAFFFEKSTQSMPPHVEKGLIFFDMKGFSLRKHWNTKSMKLILAFVTIIEKHNPERLRRLMLFNVPGAFRFAWKIIRGWLDPDVEQKVHFVKDLSVLREEIDPADLLVRYGGDRVEEYPVDGMEELLAADAQR